MKSADPPEPKPPDASKDVSPEDKSLTTPALNLKRPLTPRRSENTDDGPGLITDHSKTATKEGSSIITLTPYTPPQNKKKRIKKAQGKELLHIS